MGDMSEMKGLIVIVSLIAVTITLIVYMPSQFYEHELDHVDLPDQSALELLSYNSTYLLNVTHPSHDETFELNGYDWRFVATSFLGNYFQIYTRSYWTDYFEWDQDYFSWYYGNTKISENMVVGVSNVIDVLSPGVIDAYDSPLTLRIVNDKTSADVDLQYNTTTYSSFTEAWENDALTIILFADFDERNTSINAFTLIGMLFTASLPGIDPVLNLIISIPIVVCSAYLVFIFVLRLVGAVFGGGGA
jgi:hypothetical protein